MIDEILFSVYRLEYRYMKLVGGSSDQDQELPAAETCALDEGEDEEFDSVKFQQQSKGKRLLNKIKGITSKVRITELYINVTIVMSSYSCTAMYGTFSELKCDCL